VTGQKENAVDVQRADFGPSRWMRMGQYGFEEHELDGVFIYLKWGWHLKWGWRRSSLPPQHRASAGGDPEHES
jgi:hypothetical protein